MSFKNYLGNTLGAAGTIAGYAVGGPAGAALGGAAGNAVGGYFRDQSSLESQVQLMDHQHALNKQMFDYVSEYNTPTNQRKRLEEAGLNPLLLYGQLSSGTVTSVPSTGAGGTPIRGASDVGSVSLASQMSDIELKKSQAGLNWSMRERTEQEFSNLVVMNNKLKEELQYFLDTKELNMLQLKEKVNQAILNTSYSLEELEQLRRVNPIAYEQAIANLKFTEENTKLLQATQGKIDAEIKHIYKQMGLTDKEILKANEIINNLKSEGKLTETNLRIALKKEGFFNVDKASKYITDLVSTVSTSVSIALLFKGAKIPGIKGFK